MDDTHVFRVPPKYWPPGQHYVPGDDCDRCGQPRGTLGPCMKPAPTQQATDAWAAEQDRLFLRWGGKRYGGD